MYQCFILTVSFCIGLDLARFKFKSRCHKFQLFQNSPPLSNMLCLVEPPLLQYSVFEILPGQEACSPKWFIHWISKSLEMCQEVDTRHMFSTA